MIRLGSDIDGWGKGRMPGMRTGGRGNARPTAPPSDGVQVFRTFILSFFCHAGGAKCTKSQVSGTRTQASLAARGYHETVIRPVAPAYRRARATGRRPRSLPALAYGPQRMLVLFCNMWIGPRAAARRNRVAARIGGAGRETAKAARSGRVMRAREMVGGMTLVEARAGGTGPWRSMPGRLCRFGVWRFVGSRDVEILLFRRPSSRAR
jgi:hypothetical protein